MEEIYEKNIWKKYMEQMYMESNWNSSHGSGESREVGLTGENSGHKRGEHDEKHGEKEAAGIEERLASILSQSHVQESNQHADRQVGKQTETGQSLPKKATKKPSVITLIRRLRCNQSINRSIEGSQNVYRIPHDRLEGPNEQHPKLRQATRRKTMALRDDRLFIVIIQQQRRIRWTMAVGAAAVGSTDLQAHFPVIGQQFGDDGAAAVAGRQHKQAILLQRVILHFGTPWRRTPALLFVASARYVVRLFSSVVLLLMRLLEDGGGALGYRHH